MEAALAEGREVRLREGRDRGVTATPVLPPPEALGALALLPVFANGCEGAMKAIGGGEGAPPLWGVVPRASCKWCCRTFSGVTGRGGAGKLGVCPDDAGREEDLRGAAALLVAGRLRKGPTERSVAKAPLCSLRLAARGEIFLCEERVCIDSRTVTPPCLAEEK